MSEMGTESGAGTELDSGGQLDGVTPDSADVEDAEAAELLSGMLSDDPEVLRAEAKKWQDLSRKHERRAASNADAAKRLKEYDDANKTELQKAQEAQALAESERDAALNQHNRVMAAAAHNLPVEFIDHLGTGTDEEIMERAEILASAIDTRAREIAEQLLAQQANGGMPRMGGGRPVESMRPGSAPAAGGTPTTADEWFRRLLSGNS
jgi:hypothetical protein